MITIPQKPLSPEAYLELETISTEKHEYINGYIYAMAGASESHVTIAINLTVIMATQLQASKCTLLTSDMKVLIAAHNIFYYPDLLVTCDPRDRQNQYYKQYPCLIMEVLSPSTEAKDRGAKFAHYQSLASLQEYVLISQEEPRVEVFRRTDQQRLWLLETYLQGETVELKSINLKVPLEQIYTSLSFRPGASL